MINLDGTSILFDLDGTLVDSAPDLLAALNHVLVNNDASPVRLDDIHKIIGRGAAHMIKTSLAMQNHAISNEILTKLTDDLICYYNNHIAVYSRLFEHVMPTLEVLCAKGATLAVCTNKRQALSEKLLDSLNILPFFDAVVGADTVTVPKPDAAHILETLAILKSDPAQAMMIGDGYADREAARRAGIKCALVPFGYREQSLEELAPDWVLEDYRDLPALAAKWLG